MQNKSFAEFESTTSKIQFVCNLTFCPYGFLEIPQPQECPDKYERANEYCCCYKLQYYTSEIPPQEQGLVGKPPGIKEPTWKIKLLDDK